MNKEQTTSKRVEDYLHLYIGCKFIMKIIGTEKFTAEMTFGTNALDACFTGKINDLIKPILLLRPLSDMTEKEAIELCEWYGVYGDMPGRRTYETYLNAFDNIVVSWGTSMREKWVPLDCEVWKPEQFRYLLSKSFDIFNLIPEGLAIDRTKP